MAMAAVLVMVSCGGEGPVRSAAGIVVPEELKTGESSLKMVAVPGGTFAMGRKASGTRISGAASIHQVVLHGFAISDKPVSQAVWKDVMGSYSGTVQNPSLPVEMVSYDDCVKFLAKLSKKSGIPFSLPTEAQWEYAVSIGLADVNAGYSEWCADSFAESPDTLTIDPMNMESTDLKVVRDPVTRSSESRFVKRPHLSFHVVINTEDPVPADVQACIVAKNVEYEESCKNETVKAGDAEFRMIAVEGGTYEMGATSEQGKMAGSDESPVHMVSLDGFEIGQTEVTAGQWKAVMGSLPYKNSEGALDKPVVNVSWYDCQMFIMKLNKMTGRKFRLPTEAEWEYAARGGRKSKGNQFAGSMYVSQVAAYLGNAASDVVRVKSYQPNELGIYDMSGNAWEWCQDSMYDYSSDTESNPYYNLPGELRIMRGGSAASKWDACRVSNRSKLPANSVKSTFGFRLAL